ncbi:MAG: PEP-CTERM sorting domain-containing protein [Phycisphaerae bacterium]|nr:PEP-CTERM sorting domain-containing protein [Phycisphaerae bacterium]
MKNEVLSGWHGFINPIRLGQRSIGFVFAAFMVFLWFGYSTANAAVSAQGFSENEFFKLEWDYDLSNGTGLITLTRPAPFIPTQVDQILLRELTFITKDVELESLTFKATNLFVEEELYSGLTPIITGTENNKPIWQYGVDVESGIKSAFGFDTMPLEQFDRGKNAVTIEFDFPANAVQLMESELEYEGFHKLSALPYNGENYSTYIPKSSMDFVSVQMVPEPGTIGLLGLGGLAIGRKRKQD